MRRLKSLVTLLSLLATVGISLAAAVQVARQELPSEPAPAALDLRAWMVERDLSLESPETRAQLARRFERELEGDARRLAELGDLDSQQQQLLRENVVQLLEPLFVEKVNEYFRLPDERRQEWLDREIDRVLRLTDRQRPGAIQSPNFSSASVVGIGLFQQQVEQWAQRADPEMQAKMREFSAALQNRWFARETERLMQESPFDSTSPGR
jgi:hypothetical protein